MRHLKLAACVAVITFTIACKSNKQQEEVYTTEQTEQRSQRDGGERGGDRQRPPSADMILEKMDANKDGLLSKTEVKGRMAEKFDMIDANGDGQLSRAELENAPKPQRGQGGPR